MGKEVTLIKVGNLKRYEKDEGVQGVEIYESLLNKKTIPLPDAIELYENTDGTPLSEEQIKSMGYLEEIVVREKNNRK